MTTHYRLRVVELEPPRAVIEFRCVHPDLGHPAPEWFTAQVLIEVWWVQRKPAHPCGALLQELQDLAEGVDVEISRDEYAALRRGEAFGQFWKQGERYFRKTRDLATFVVRSGRPFVDMDYERLGDDPPRGNLTLVAKDPQLLSHLEQGFAWDSVVYDVLPHLGFELTPMPRRGAPPSATLGP